MDYLIPPVLVSYLKPKECTMFILACGALVEQQRAFNDLVKSVKM